MGILRVELSDVCTARVSGMDEHAVTEVQGCTRRKGEAAVLAVVVLEIVQAEYVSGKQPVSAGMPPGRVSRVRRMIENCDPQRLAIDYTGKICPIGTIAPNLFFALAAFGIDHL